MARKIFISYKYSDADVRSIIQGGLVGLIGGGTTARNYVDELARHLDANDNIYKGEDDGESLAGFKEEYIESKLRDKIFDSTITIVLISKNMKDSALSENDQWIPWEVSYSLKEMTRNGRTSLTNAVLAVVLPDKNGSYDYFIQPIGCARCGSIRWRTDLLFSILGKNMFNRKQPKTYLCPNGVCGVLHTGADHSYIYPVKWDDFIANVNIYLNHATSINTTMNDYELVKSVV